MKLIDGLSNKKIEMAAMAAMARLFKMSELEKNLKLN